MKSYLKVYNIPHHSDEWYEFRKNGVGGSEIGTVLGINKYDTAVRLFHEKIGSIEPRKEDNEKMFWGRELESQIAEKWQYWDGSQEGYLENFKNKNIVRSCRNVNGYIVNPKYPWLFMSLDRLINIKGGFNLVTGEPLSTEAVLECKNMSYWASQSWADEIPVYHLAQVTQYMIILETDYSEIAVLRDGSSLTVESIQLNEELADRIINISKKFWYDRVLPARKSFEDRSKYESEGDLMGIERSETKIQELEPEPDSSEAYNEFMNERFVKERESIIGKIDIYNIARKDRFYLSMKGRIDKERTQLQNNLIKYLSDNSAESIDFGSLGNVNWSERKGSKNRSFGNKIKEKPSEDYLEGEFEKMNAEDY